MPDKRGTDNRGSTVPVVSISHSLFFSEAEKKAIQSEVPLG